MRPTAPLTVALATRNPHKVAELSAIFDTLGLTGVRLVALDDAARTAGASTPTSIPEPAETGATFEANAAIKALAYAAATGTLCLADDSGIEIDALAGRPGVISSHYSTDGREAGLSREQRDRDNNDRVLRELTDFPPDRRAARFICVMALAEPPRGSAPARVIATVRGAFEGRIGLRGQVPRGAHGFGYDPLFLVAPDFARTGAELDPAEKNRLSHRAAAARLMAGVLLAYAER